MVVKITYKNILLKVSLFLLIMIYLYGCVKNENSISKQETKEALLFYLDSIISKGNAGPNFTIYPIFYPTLEKENLDSLIRDSIFKSEDIEFMKNQYINIKEENIGDYLNTYYINKLDTSINEYYKMNIYFSPPLFTLNKEFYVIYARKYFMYEGKPGWNHFYFIMKRKNNTWQHVGIIEVENLKQNWK